MVTTTAPAFANIGLVGRSGSHAVVESLKTVLAFLQRRNCAVFIEEETAASFAEALPGKAVSIVKKTALGDQCDLVIVVGGDGSMLGAARVLCNSRIPVLGINRGSLGFLTDI